MLSLLLDLHRTLSGPHPLREESHVQKRLSDEELDAVKYDELIDEEGREKEGLLAGLGEEARLRTGRGYVVIGGSGFVGTYVSTFQSLHHTPQSSS